MVEKCCDRRLSSFFGASTLSGSPSFLCVRLAARGVVLHFWSCCSVRLSLPWFVCSVILFWFIAPASWLNLCVYLAPFWCGRPWIMFEAVSFTTTWLGQLCILTIWRDSCPFSSPPLNMKNLCPQRILVWNVQPPGVYIPSYPCQHRKVLQLWHYMEASLPTWWSIQNRISVLLQPVRHQTVHQFSPQVLIGFPFL
jgi:hypothetical protein